MSIEIDLPYRYTKCDCGDLHFPTDGICPACGSSYEFGEDKHVAFRRFATGPARELLDRPLGDGEPANPLALEKELESVLKTLPQVLDAIADESNKSGGQLVVLIRRYRRVASNTAATHPDETQWRSWRSFVRAVTTTKEMVVHFLDFLDAASPDEAEPHIRLAEAANQRLPTEPSGPRPTPTNRALMTPMEAESAAALWLRKQGFDAHTTSGGPDSGVDVAAPGLVAQVKHQQAHVGRPEVQKLHGVASSRDALAVFFSTSGFTTTAIEWASDVGMALMILDGPGSARPVNQIAKFLSAPR